MPAGSERQKCLKLEQEAGDLPFTRICQPRNIRVSLHLQGTESTDTCCFVLLVVIRLLSELELWTVWPDCTQKLPTPGTRLKAVRCTGAWNGMITCHRGRREQNMGRVDMVGMNCHSTDTEVGATLNLPARV